MTAEGYRLLADGTLVLHAAFVSFVVLGQFFIFVGWVRGWKFTRQVGFRVIHLLGMGFVVLEAWFGVPCPLTLLENALRVAAGGHGYGRSFVTYWLTRAIFYEAEPWVFTLVYTVFALIVVLTFILYPPRRHLRRVSGGRSVGAE